jgi:hypothetical protein
MDYLCALQKSTLARARAELGWVEGRGTEYDVVFTNLPYTLGSRWRELSGGKPVQIECQNVGEFVELFSGMLVPRIIEGILQVT